MKSSWRVQAAIPRGDPLSRRHRSRPHAPGNLVAARRRSLCLAKIGMRTTDDRSLGGLGLLRAGADDAHRRHSAGSVSRSLRIASIARHLKRAANSRPTSWRRLARLALGPAPGRTVEGRDRRRPERRQEQPGERPGRLSRAAWCRRSPAPRDVVTAVIAMDGWPVELTDTAGMRAPSSPLERQGIARAEASGAKCGPAISGSSMARPCRCYPDNRRKWSVVINKIDLPAAWDSRSRRAWPASRRRHAWLGGAVRDDLAVSRAGAVGAWRSGAVLGEAGGVDSRERACARSKRQATTPCSTRRSSARGGLERRGFARRPRSFWSVSVASTARSAASDESNRPIHAARSCTSQSGSTRSNP